MQATLYGIRNCDSVKKARQWLETHKVDYHFHDFRADGLDKQTLSRWISAQGWDALLNRRSTTWRQLDDAAKAALDEELAHDLMLEQPTLIKRPVLEYGKQVVVGFSESGYQDRFGNAGAG